MNWNCIDQNQKRKPLFLNCGFIIKLCHNCCFFSSVEEDKDAPVQGPLPYEPDDAPWKKTSESGIRKL